jgi:NAD(P)-dependent dehydrogenase (short-subunit alcohol dehydrogenase family)
MNDLAGVEASAGSEGEHEMSNLKGQIALVTGASRGIGRAIALELGAQGATVVGTATTEAGAAEIGEGLRRCRHHRLGHGGERDRRRGVRGADRRDREEIRRRYRCWSTMPASPATTSPCA